MTCTLRCLSLIPNYKGNGCRGYKRVLAFLKSRGLVKRAENKEEGIEWDRPQCAVSWLNI